MTTHGDTEFVGAIDQGTSSTRFVLFDRAGAPVVSRQLEHKQNHPRPGWLEHDPEEIWTNTQAVIRDALSAADIQGEQVAAVGIANQRETVVLWDRTTRRPLCNAIVWSDTRTSAIVSSLQEGGAEDEIRRKTGLPFSTYFSAPKIRWLVDNDSEVASVVDAGRCAFGTIDSWLLMKLTGEHVTDVSNASRTLLMDLRSCEWSEELLSLFSLPAGLLPEIRASLSTEPLGVTDPEGPFGAAIPIHAVLGDQQAALFGQTCFDAGDTKNTYGTGCFLLLNTGSEPVHSNHGLLTTIAYRIDDKNPLYALEGSVAVAGALVQWLRDSIGIIRSSPEIESLASSVEDSGGVYLVPAFAGLFAPHWRSDARGVVTGLTGYSNAGHIARAALESTAFQTADLVEAMEQDSGAAPVELRVDGGMVENDLLMQFQADILGIPVVRPRITETTALGAAYGAGLASGYWKNRDELAEQWKEERRWIPRMGTAERGERRRIWRRAVERSFGWVDQE